MVHLYGYVEKNEHFICGGKWRVNSQKVPLRYKPTSHCTTIKGSTWTKINCACFCHYLNVTSGP